MGRYKTITLRVLETDKEVLNWLDSQESMNGSILNLIRQELGLLKQAPENYDETIKTYEVIEERGRFRVSLASFDTLGEANKFARLMFNIFDDTQRIMIVHRKPAPGLEGTYMTGRLIATIKSKEEKENA